MRLSVLRAVRAASVVDYSKAEDDRPSPLDPPLPPLRGSGKAASRAGRRTGRRADSLDCRRRVVHVSTNSRGASACVAQVGQARGASSRVTCDAESSALDTRSARRSGCDVQQACHANGGLTTAMSAPSRAPQQWCQPCGCSRRRPRQVDQAPYFGKLGHRPQGARGTRAVRRSQCPAAPRSCTVQPRWRRRERRHQGAHGVDPGDVVGQLLTGWPLHFASCREPGSTSAPADRRGHRCVDRNARPQRLRRLGVGASRLTQPVRASMGPYSRKAPNSPATGLEQRHSERRSAEPNSHRHATTCRVEQSSSDGVI